MLASPIPRMVIVSAGALSAVGATLRVQGAALHAGLSRISLHPPTEEPDPTSTSVARAAFFGEEVGDAERLKGFLWAASAEAALPLKQVSDADLHGWVLLPEGRPPYVPEDLIVWEQAVRGALAPLPVSKITLLQGTEHSLAEVFAAASSHLLSNPTRALAFVLAADSLVSDDAMDHLVETRRLARADRPWGLVPGEGGACLFLAHETWSKLPQTGAIASVSGIGRGSVVPNQRPSPKGQALTEAVQQALTLAAPQAPIRLAFCDLNGERSRSDDWSFAAPRFATFLAADMEQVTPATSSGDLGAANTLSLMASAADELSSARFQGSALIAASGEEGRACAMVLDSAAVPSARQTNPSPLKVLAAFDVGVIEEMIREVKVLWERRQDWLAVQASAPLPDWTARAVLDRRIDRLSTALSSCGLLIRSRAIQDLDTAEPPAVYWSARVLVRIDQGVEPTFLGKGAVVSNETMLVLAEALRDSGISLITAAQRLVQDEAWRRVGLLVVAHAGAAELCPVVCQIAHLGPKALGWAFLMALSRVGKREDAGLLGPWLAADDAALSNAAIMAWVKLDVAACSRWLLNNAGSALAFLGLTADARAFDLLLSSAGVHGGRASFYLALAQLGDPRGFACLLEGLSDPVVAAEAAAALSLVTGANLLDEVDEVRVAPDIELFSDELVRRQAGDTEVGVTRSRVVRLCRSPERWNSWLTQNGRLFSTGHRYRLGRLLDRRVAVESLRASWVPARLRLLLSVELAAVFGIEAAVEPDAAALKQFGQLSKAAHEATLDGGLPAGSWGYYAAS